MSEKKPVVEYAGSWGEALSYPLACVGAIVGIVLGVIIVHLAWRVGIYALIVVGLMAGIGARLAARRGDLIVASMAGALGLIGGVWTEWSFWPFRQDDSLAYFLQHITSVMPFHLLVILVGAAVAFFSAWWK